MDKEPNIYTRLPGLGTRSTHTVRLWQGPDHLLFVASSLIGERYKRFYFADIQAIVVCKTASWLVRMIVLLVFAGLSGLALAGSDERTPRMVFAAITLVFLIALAIHAALGATCRCTIRTAVQTEELITLKRVRNAKKVLDRIHPLIEAAQQPQPAEPIANI